ncbi:MAG: M15 family metallopeptidase [Oscillospiraceae bacterium]|jgi:hypothetical protein|nr:M15 family metallopeptidase [Oscillospiraceae bacterium]
MAKVLKVTKIASKMLIALGFVLIIFLTPLNVFAVEPFVLSDGFSFEDISEDFELSIDEKSNFDDNIYIRRKDLRLLKFKCFGFDGEIYNGELVVAYEATNPITKEVTNVSKEVLEILKELFEKEYPIDKISCFYFRNIGETDRLSQHAYGLAIDINYNKNPCLIIDENGEILRTIPKDLEKYADRTLEEKGMIKIGDDCYNAFTKRFWEWGGSWDNPKDFMHFQKFPSDYPKPEPKYKKTTVDPKDPIAIDPKYPIIIEPIEED